MKVLIIGADGFIGKNLYQRLLNFSNIELNKITRKTSNKKLIELIHSSKIIFHFAGANREKKIINFSKKNFLFTKKLCEILKTKKNKTKFIFASTTHINKKTPYGVSKKNAEKALIGINKKFIDLYIYRLPNVFGKWAKPNYNSVVATFCNQIINKKKITIIKNEELNFIYIDDLIDEFIKRINIKIKKKTFIYRIAKTNKISVKKLAKKLIFFREALVKSEIPNLKNIFEKNLYSTYLSYMEQSKAFFKLKSHKDSRGEFVELFKNINFGQISYFSINKKQIRGNHYHDSKVEKFYLINGKVKFEFFNIHNNKKSSMILQEKNKRVLFTLPGWSHKIKNIGSDKANFVVWANEIFNRKKPDTYYYKF